MEGLQIMATFDLSGRTALVTGGNGGIGLGISEALAEAGANVLIAGRDEEKNQAASGQINVNGGQCRAIRCDVDSLEDIDTAIAEAIDAFGGLQILVNNAGIAGGGNIAEMSVEKFDRVMAVNVRSIFLMCKYRWCHRWRCAFVLVSYSHQVFSATSPERNAKAFWRGFDG